MITTAEERALMALRREKLQKEFPGMEVFIGMGDSVREARKEVPPDVEPEDPMDAYPVATPEELEALQRAIDLGDQLDGLATKPRLR